jgi:hypothetical protein
VAFSPEDEAIVRRLAREEFDKQIMDHDELIGLGNGTARKWHSFFSEVSPITAREAVKEYEARTTFRKSFMQHVTNQTGWLWIAGLLVAMSTGIQIWLKEKP